MSTEIKGVAAIEEALETKTRKADELGAKRSELEAQKAKARRDLGRAVADGQNEGTQAAIRARLREYSDAIDGLDSGRAIIETDMSELRAALQPAQLVEAETAKVAAAAAYWDALKAADEVFSELWAQFMANEGAALESAIEAAHTTQNEYERAGGHPAYVQVTERGGEHVEIRRVMYSVNAALEGHRNTTRKLADNERLPAPSWYQTEKEPVFAQN
jgi:chromosome segregation ATPase